MASFDYDVLITGSGFGGSVAALRLSRQGAVINGPAIEALRMYEAQVVEGGIQIRA